MLIQRDGLRVVIGLGKTGLSCVRHLRRKGYPVAVNDTREHPPGLAELRAEFPEVEVSLGGLDQALLLRASEIVSSPGVSVKEPAIAAAIAAGIPVGGDVELFCREVTAPIVAITGSNAKSTVTTLVGLMAARDGRRVGVCGNIGTPVLDMLAEGDKDIYVMELSSFQLETTHSLRAAVAVVLNISEDHMDRYTGMVEYHQAKHRIFRNCQRYVFNRDDALTRPLIADDVPGTSFGLGAPDLNQYGVLRVDGQPWLARGRETLMPVSDLQIFGEHNVANALACLALGEAVGFGRDAMLATLREFSGLKHRCQRVALADGIGWYNDSKGTNVGATLAAINGLGAAIGGKLLLIAGGVGKGQDFSPLSPALAQFGKTLLLIGEDGPAIDRAVSAPLDRRYCATLDEAIAQARALAQAGDAVLLSPACASFDMFKHYEDRGDQFAAGVQRLLEGT
ncbi:UDP-N-acetylmuramoyl-L-alanine--D-glutamate ligase [Amnimonas aquatica]|uniref:UDP-N-acetylmuramoylalanine--D-glutamate ligase n=1 Tax=Amnimonas aquatica TaxID=2094561 RepID=A0A2P6AUX1_9GAMM|nr:UDP-N-acetylmuramoyl-L-alanine--D-glutamate ligase [Amnimonas aquatica]PQA50945.1 UDP-N-acetylmuramoyl-L-alanine--D-glutamate ligase [Amnimonas aquatica]